MLIYIRYVALGLICLISLINTGLGIPITRVELLLICAAEMLCVAQTSKQQLAHIVPRYSLFSLGFRPILPNSLSIHFNEKWLMPRGGSRAAAYYHTFPLAFCYYQETARTYRLELILT
jgi:hypothetical protein